MVATCMCARDHGVRRASWWGARVAYMHGVSRNVSRICTPALPHAYVYMHRLPAPADSSHKTSETMVWLMAYVLCCLAGPYSFLTLVPREKVHFLQAFVAACAVGVALPTMDSGT